MQKVSALKVYETLRGKIGEEESRTLIEWVEESIESGAATKADIAVLQERMATKADLTALKEGMTTKVDLEGMATKADLEVLKERMATKADIAALKDEIWKLRLALLGIAILIVATNPKVIEILGKLLGIIH